jgi:hypothetical protein
LTRRGLFTGRGAWLAAAALAVYVAGVAIWVGYDRRSAREAFAPGSVYATNEKGLSLAYGYLRERSGGRAAVLRRRVDSESVPAAAVVFRVQPGWGPFLGEEEEGEEKDKDGKDKKDAKQKKPADAKKAAPKEKKKEKEKEEPPARVPPLLTAAEEAWVRAGGRLVLALDGWYGPVEVKELAPRQPVRKVFPLWPGVSRLHPTERHGLSGPGLSAAHAVVLAGATPVIARQPIGAGEVILLSCPEIFQNRFLARGHHLALLEALAGLGEGRRVYFDERVHGLGEDGGVIEALGAWGLGPLLALAVLGAAAGFWRAAVRVGAADRDDRDTRSDAVELVDSLADLYDRALGRGDAVRLYHESFVHTLAVDTGLRGPALERRAHEILERAGGFEPAPAGDLNTDVPRDRFDRDLRTLNEAFRRISDAKRDAKRNAKRT